MDIHQEENDLNFIGKCIFIYTNDSEYLSL